MNKKSQGNNIRCIKVNIITAVLIFLLAPQGFAQVASMNNGKQPNVLFISIDDLNDWINPVSMGGLPGLKTPNYDRLAKMSMSFTNAYVASPACAPSRVAIMTGVHPVTSGVTGWQYPEWRKRPALQNVLT